jgi:hypothetical protein
MNFDALIVFLSGKKMIISACLAVVIGYLATIGVIDTNLSTAILSILNILFGGIEIVGDRAVKAGTPLGVAIYNKRK